MRTIDFLSVIKNAWQAYDEGRVGIKHIRDVSAMVSTNHVYKINLKNKETVFAKLSYFGKYEHFKEDHAIIHQYSAILPPPYEHFLADSLMKNGGVFTYREKNDLMDVWVVFYQPVPIKNKLPRRLSDRHILRLGKELAKFHLATDALKNDLPPSSKTLLTDIYHLLYILNTPEGEFLYCQNIPIIKEQCEIFLENAKVLGYESFSKIPVFVDWNIGNFSVDDENKFFSRWDYDWFRMSSRVMDFYFFSRIVSKIGDKTVFSYLADPLMEERFMMFLKEYHKIYPLTEPEILFIKEAYRFFILNYVIKDGNYFFHQVYANKLQAEAFRLYFPQVDKKFNGDKLLMALNKVHSL